MIVGILGIIFVTCVIIFLTISFYITIFGGGPFVPTPMDAVHKVLKEAGIKKGQKIYDIGAGDGRFLHFAEKDYGAISTGFEVDPFVFLIAKIRQIFWKWKGKIIFGSFFKQNFSKADIIFCYMLPRTMKKFHKTIMAGLKKKTKIVSYTFQIPDLKPSRIIPKKGKISKIFIYEI
ncbi:class I SAM-dependent methyltransferase [Candidatus Peregrinibacteria bacterium]|nr:class I SAM-dependent methyltransferase [Candidatus Peregrinibacteria bacterium]